MADVPKKLDLILQVLKVDDIAHNPEKKESAKIKQKYLLSDGVASVKAIISDQVLLKTQTKPRKFDIIRLSQVKKIELTKNSAQKGSI